MSLQHGSHSLKREIVSKKKEILCILLWTTVFAVFFYFGQIDEDFNQHWMLTTQDLLKLGITIFTSTLLHSTFDHVINNVFAFIIFGGIFFIQVGVKKGNILIVTMIYLLHFFELLLYFGLLITFEILKQNYMRIHNISYWSYEIFPLKGLGASGMICGLIGCVIVGILRSHKRKNLIRNFRDKTLSNSQLPHMVVIVLVLFQLF